MKQTMKLEELLNVNSFLKAIIDNTDLNVDCLFKFRLLGIMKIFEPHVQNFESIRNEKIIEYGKKDDDGNVKINADDKEALEKFGNDLKKILDTTIELDYQKLSPDDVFNNGVPSDYLVGLYPIISIN